MWDQVTISPGFVVELFLSLAIVAFSSWLVKQGADTPWFVSFPCKAVPQRADRCSFLGIRLCPCLDHVGVCLQKLLLVRTSCSVICTNHGKDIMSGMLDVKPRNLHKMLNKHHNYWWILPQHLVLAWNYSQYFKLSLTLPLLWLFFILIQSPLMMPWT